MTPAKVRTLLAVFLACFAFASPAFAAWHKAESDRFVIYSDSRPEDLKELGELLERYHIAMELETGRRVPVPSPSNRLTVYMVGSYDDLRILYGNRNAAVGGFYIPRANGSVTFVPNPSLRVTRESGRRRGSSRINRAKRGGRDLAGAMRVLLHEYAHHFLIGSSPTAMPVWLSEGAAEYFSAARFNDDGTFDIGLPNNNRAWEISRAAPVSLRELLDYELYQKNRGNRYDAFYGRSWLLYHYLRFNPERQGQLVAYYEAVARGTDSLEAGKSIFGDLDALEKELARYADTRSMAGMRIPADAIRVAKVTTSKLSKGHAEAMDVILKSKRGVSRDEAIELLPQARGIAEEHPRDAHVQAALAEAAYDAGEDDEAIAAADRAIAIDPSVKNAYVQKGYALFRKASAVEGDGRAAAYDAAMEPFAALNALEANHTQPLIYYYRSFAERGVEVPKDAKFALERALQLAPFDQMLAINTATMKAGDGELALAKLILGPVEASPHGGREAALAGAMIAYIERSPKGLPLDLSKVTQAFEKAELGSEQAGAGG